MLVQHILVSGDAHSMLILVCVHSVPLPANTLFHALLGLISRELVPCLPLW